MGIGVKVVAGGSWGASDGSYCLLILHGKGGAQERGWAVMPSWETVISCGPQQRLATSACGVSPISTLLPRPPGLYPLWKMLYLQRRSAELAAQPGRRHGQWPGDHAGHPAGGVPAHLAGDKYAGQGQRAQAWACELGTGWGPPHGAEMQKCPSLPADETSFEAGIRVQIHSQEEPPYIHELGFGVSPGFQTFVSCQEQRVSAASWARGGT